MQATLFDLFLRGGSQVEEFARWSFIRSSYSFGGIDYLGDGCYHEKLLFASGQLQGVAQDWWESYQYGCPNNVGQITWKEFSESFWSYHIPTGVVELKPDEFQALKQGSMTVCEYRDMFTQLSRYAPEEVDNDAQK